MPLVIGYDVSSMSRAAVHSSPIMMSCAQALQMSAHGCGMHASPRKGFALPHAPSAAHFGSSPLSAEWVGRLLRGRCAPGRVYRGRGVAIGGSGRSGLPQCRYRIQLAACSWEPSPLRAHTRASLFTASDFDAAWRAARAPAVCLVGCLSIFPRSHTASPKRGMHTDY
eukprot:scaffold85404_cov63-Phaeocystis_antarctica.AAC.2